MGHSDLGNFDLFEGTLRGAPAKGSETFVQRHTLGTKTWEPNAKHVHAEQLLLLSWESANAYNDNLQELSDINRAQADGNLSDNALMIASIEGRDDDVKLLLRHGANVYQNDECGRLALHWAAHYGHTKTVNQLLADPRVNPNTKEWAFGRTALFLAAEGTHLETLKTLCNDPRVLLNVKNALAQTLLCQASEAGEEDIVEILLAARKLRLDEMDDMGRTALHLASKKGHITVVERLLEEPCCPLNQKDNNEISPILLAWRYEHLDVVKLLIGMNNIDTQDAFRVRGSELGTISALENVVEMNESQ